MADNLSKERYGLNLAVETARTVLDAHSARQLNQFEVAASAVRFDFFNTLSEDRNTYGYVDRLQEELFSAYDELADGLNNPFIKQKVTTFLDKKKETDRQAAIELGQRNAQVFGGQELITGLDGILARPMGADETLLAQGSQGEPGYKPSYREKKLAEIYGNIGRAYAGGIIGQERAAELSRSYTEKVNIGMSRDMGYSALAMMLDGGTTASDALDLIEQVIRSDGGELEDIINTAEISTDPAASGAKVMSEQAIGSLSMMAQAYSTVQLTPDQEEKLVGDMRRESNALTARRAKQEKEKLAINDIELSKMWASGDEGRQEIAKDEFALLYSLYDPSTQDGINAINGWIADYGKWQETVAKETREREEQEEEAKSLLGYDIRMDAAREAGNIADMKAIKDDIFSTPMDDAKRNGMINALNTMIETAENGNTDKSAYYAKLAGFDTTIAEYGDAVRAGNGDSIKIKSLRKEVLSDADMIKNEEDRNQRVSQLNGLLDDMVEAPDKGQAKVQAESAISLLYSDRTATPADVRKKIRGYESTGVLPGDDAYTWYSRIDNREEVLGNIASVETFDAINRTFDARIRQADINEEERALLAQEQSTALTAYDNLLNDQKYRDMMLSQQKEEMDKLLVDALAPAVSRSIWDMVGLGADTTNYDLYQAAGSDTYRDTYYQEVKTEWKADFEEEFDNTWIVSQIGEFRTRQGADGNKRVIEFSHPETGVMFTKRGNNWYVKFEGGSYEKVGRSERRRLEALRG